MSPMVAEIMAQLEMPMAVLLKLRAGARVRRRYQRVRGDSLPEQTRYRDDGCDIHEQCLTCPLPRCRYEEPGGLRGMINSYRDRQIALLRDNGVPIPDIAEWFGLSHRSIFRILESQEPASLASEARCA